MVINTNQALINLCYHEVGHWVIAKKLKFEVGDITISLSNGFLSGSATIIPWPKKNDTLSLREHLQNRVSVLFAGANAEVISNPNKTDDAAAKLLETSALDDNKKACELIHILTGILYPDTELSSFYPLYKKTYNKCWYRSAEIVNQSEKIISEIATWMILQIKNKKSLFKKTDLENKYNKLLL